MRNQHQARHLVTGALLVCYLLPIFLLTAYSALWIPSHDRLQLLAVGILTSMLGTLVITLLMKRWELALPTRHHSPLRTEIAPSAETADEIERLQQALGMQQELQDSLSQELQQQIDAQQRLSSERDELQHQYEQLEQGLAAQHDRSADLLSAKESQIQEYQQTIFDQQLLLEKRQKQIIALENTARDLKYELKTLIDLTERIQAIDEDVNHDPEPPPSPPAEDFPPAWAMTRTETAVSTLTDPTVQLKRCINIAQKLTGARHLTGHTPRFQDMSVEGYALDLRRLCDNLRSESGSMILLYSQKEDKLLFVNDRVRDLLGWPPEKFLQDFSNLFVGGKSEFSDALRKTISTPQVEVDVTLKSRTGESRGLRCQIGMIPTGIFKTHIVAVAQPQ